MSRYMNEPDNVTPDPVTSKATANPPAATVPCVPVPADPLDPLALTFFRAGCAANGLPFDDADYADLDDADKLGVRAGIRAVLDVSGNTWTPAVSNPIALARAAHDAEIEASFRESPSDEQVGPCWEDLTERQRADKIEGMSKALEMSGVPRTQTEAKASAATTLRTGAPDPDARHVVDPLKITAEVYGIYAEIKRDRDFGADTETSVPPADTLLGTVRHTLNEVAVALRKVTGLRGDLSEIVDALVKGHADGLFFQRYLERETPSYGRDERRYDAEALRKDALIRFGVTPPDTVVLAEARAATVRRDTFTPFDNMCPNLRAGWTRAARVDLTEITPVLIENLARHMFRACRGNHEPPALVWPGWLFEAECTLRMPASWWPTEQVSQRVAGLRSILAEGTTP